MVDEWGRSTYQCQNRDCRAKANLTQGDVLDLAQRHQAANPQTKHDIKCLDPEITA